MAAAVAMGGVVTNGLPARSEGLGNVSVTQEEITKRRDFREQWLKALSFRDEVWLIVQFQKQLGKFRSESQKLQDFRKRIEKELGIPTRDNDEAETLNMIENACEEGKFDELLKNAQAIVELLSEIKEGEVTEEKITNLEALKKEQFSLLRHVCEYNGS